MRPFLLALSATLLPFAALQAEDQMLSGVHLSYAMLFTGKVKVDGKTSDWDEGQRIELHLRDYYFEQQSHHPFAEIGFFYEDHQADSDGLEVDAETIAFRAAVGSAIPLWTSFDRSLVAGISPELGLHLGSLSVDVRANGQHDDDDAFRYGASAGLNGWLAINRSVALGVGVIGSYWRATEIDLGTGSSNPSGWDLGARVSFGFLF